MFLLGRNTQQDWDKKVALGRDVEAWLQSLQAELDFINKQLAALQQQHQEAIGQAGYYKAERDAFKLEQDTLWNQLLSPGSLTPVAPAPATPLQEPTQQASSPKLVKLPVKGQSTSTQNVGGLVFDRGGQGLNR